MRSHGLRQLVNDESVASVDYQKACCKLFQQVVKVSAIALVTTDLLQLDETDKFVELP